MGVLRSKELQDKYDEYRKERSFAEGCALCDVQPFKDFEFWKITKVMFPLDNIAELDHLILPKRHVTEKDITAEERSEFQNIKDGYLDENYDLIIEGTSHRKSIPDHFHVHLVVTKKN